MLGFIVAPLGQRVDGQYPNEIQYSYGGNGTYLCPPDPQFNTRGEPGMYYDTPLGGPAIPTDAELATVYGRTPVAAAWVRGQEAYFPSPWRTPGGWNPAGPWGPQPSLSGSGMSSLYYNFRSMYPMLQLAIVGAAGFGAYLLIRGRGRKRRR